MARFDAAANPGKAIERGFYVERPGRSVADEIAARVELRPGAAHLLVGGVGSGKTTQLLVARDRINKLPDVRAFYVDVSAKHDLKRMVPGALVIAIGMALAASMDPSTQDPAPHVAKEWFRKWAYGFLYDPREGGYEADGAWQDGMLSPPGPIVDMGGWARNASEFEAMPTAIAELASLTTFLSGAGQKIVFLVDSLDRILEPTSLAKLIDQDVSALRWAGFGVVLVGPQRLMYGPDRAVADKFDYFYHQPVVDVSQDGAGLEFFVRVLRARSDADILSEASCLRLAEQSGGVLRDLITLAQAAGEEAYLTGADQIRQSHVDAAADAFGRKHLLGLGPDELEVLQRVRTKGIFVQTSDKDLALLVTRRVLEYQNGRARYAVHPTIEPLLAQLAETP